MKLLNTLQTPWGLYKCISLGLRVRFWAAWLILRQELSWILFLNAHLAVPLALLVLLVLLVLLARLPHCSAHQACWLPSWGFKHWCYTGRTSQLSHLNTYFTAFCFFTPYTICWARLPSAMPFRSSNQASNVSSFVSCGRLACLGSRHCPPRSWQTSRLSRFYPTILTILSHYSRYRLSPNLQMSRSLSQDCLPNMKRTFYIIKPSISWLANIEFVEELVTWWAIARPRMSKSYSLYLSLIVKWNKPWPLWCTN